MSDKEKTSYTLKDYEEAKQSVEYFAKVNIETISLKGFVLTLEYLKDDILVMYGYLDSIHKDKRRGLIEDSGILKNTFNKVVVIRRTFSINRDQKLLDSKKGSVDTTMEIKLCNSIEELITSLEKLVFLDSKLQEDDMMDTDYELKMPKKENFISSSDKKIIRYNDLLVKIKNFAALPENPFKMLKTEEFGNIFSIVCSIIYIIEMEKYPASFEDNKEIKSLLFKLNIARNYYKKVSSFDCDKASELKRLGEEKYFQCEKPSRYIIIDWTIITIEEYLKSIRYY